MSADSDSLRVFYPEFADATAWPDVTVDTFIDEAAAELDYNVWGATKYRRGKLALAAHLMALAKKSAAAATGVAAATGGVASVKTGDESITYAAAASSGGGSDSDALRTTPYGLEFMRIEAQVSGHPFITF